MRSLFLAVVVLFTSLSASAYLNPVPTTQVSNVYLSNPGNSAYRLTLSSPATGTDTGGFTRSCNVIYFENYEPLAASKYATILAAILAGNRSLTFNVDTSQPIGGWCHMIEVVLY